MTTVSGWQPFHSNSSPAAVFRHPVLSLIRRSKFEFLVPYFTIKHTDHFGTLLGQHRPACTH